MEPATSFLSPRPFPRAAARPAPPAGPGPPPSGLAGPGPEPEMLAGPPPAPDPGRLITDPRSGRTYFKGRLLGKVGWEASGGVLVSYPDLVSGPGGFGDRGLVERSLAHASSSLSS